MTDKDKKDMIMALHGVEKSIRLYERALKNQDSYTNELVERTKRNLADALDTLKEGKEWLSTNGYDYVSELKKIN